MLEQPRKTGTKVISHMLTSHGGELYLHVLAIQRSCLEDPPSISEGCGGRVTDYRISVSGGNKSVMLKLISIITKCVTNITSTSDIVAPNLVAFISENDTYMAKR